MARKRKRRGRSWVSGLKLRKGRMTRACRRMGYGSATCECLRKIKAKGGPSAKRAAILGMRFKGCSGVKGPIGRKK